MSPQRFARWFPKARAADLEKLGATIELEAAAGEVIVQGLSVAPPRRAGRGRAALALLCADADAHGVPLAVEPIPIRILIDDPIPQSDLERFYAEAGFEAPALGRLWRRPAA